MAEQQAQLIASRAARAELEALHAQGLVPRAAYEHLRSEYQVNIAEAERELRRINEQHLAQGARILLAVRRRLIDAERTALLAARRNRSHPRRHGGGHAGRAWTSGRWAWSTAAPTTRASPASDRPGRSAR